MGVVSALYKGFIIGQEGTPGRFNSKNYGVYITGEGVYNVPMRDAELITIPGRNGALIKDNGRYENIQVTYHCGMFGDDQTDFASNLASFRERLASYSVGGWGRGPETFYLYDDYNTDEFRLASYLGGLEVESASLGQAGQFDITFECKPQRFLKSGENYINMYTSPWRTNNTTDWDSSPLIYFTMTGTSGTIELYAETYGTSYTITITNAPLDTTIYVDCEIGEAYTGSRDRPVSANQYVNIGAELPKMRRGITRVTYSANVSGLHLMPRWWKL